VDGQRHRDDGPAYISSHEKIWYKKDKMHRDDGPAKETDHYLMWLVDNKFHRTDGPAVIWADGKKLWYLNNLLHREDGPAFEDAGTKKWYRHGKLYRENGPTIEYANGFEWRITTTANTLGNTEILHRLDGPAAVINGIEGYFIDGAAIKKKDFKKAVKAYLLNEILEK
jgi:hypothetical protein